MRLLHCCCFVTVALLLLLLPAANAASLEAVSRAAAAAATGGHSLDAWCIAYRCPGQAYACVTDSNCRSCLACLHGCGSGETCSAGCLHRCDADRRLADFLACAVAVNRCVQLQPPVTGGGGDGDGDCRAESLPAWGPPVSLAEAAGRWFAVRGGHPFHDCHPCRSELLDPAGGLAVGSFRFDGAKVEHRRRILGSWDNGTLLLGMSKAGQEVTETWRLSRSPSNQSSDGADVAGDPPRLLLLSYCGSAGVWQYRGRLLLSRQPPHRQPPVEGGGRQRQPAFACGVQHDQQCGDLLPPGQHNSDEL